ncbi:MAG: hypothetical protein M3R49_01920 [Chloroflexota bacterium]|nr:hypothetical protein [Chloroflexota bacterium]
MPVCGSSGAAPYILAFAARHPGRVRAATILVGAAQIVDDEASQLIGLNAEGYRLAKAGDADGMNRLLAPVRDSLLADAVASFGEVMEMAPPLDQAIMRVPPGSRPSPVGLGRHCARGVEGWVDESLALSASWPEIDLAAVRTSLTCGTATAIGTPPCLR